MMHSAEKKVTGNSIYTHIVYYTILADKNMDQFSIVNSSLLSFMTFSFTLFFTSSVSSLLPLSCYIHNSKKCALRNIFQQYKGSVLSFFFLSPPTKPRSAE